MRLVHTLRHLRWEQFVYRLYYRLKKLHVAESRFSGLNAGFKSWQGLSASSLHTDDGVQFQFLGITGQINQPADWNEASLPKLWLYHCHYLDDLNAREADQSSQLCHTLANRWIAENPPAYGNGWEPYVLSLRIVNLVKWLSRQSQHEPHWLPSLATQAEALSRQPEYHILGNHLFANGKALVFAGSYLKGKDADHWLQKGLKILDREIPEQFLPDGGHFERSPMYHCTLLWDLCDLIHLADCSALPDLESRRSQWLAVVQQGLCWLDAMTHPDGDIAFFNDAAFGMAPRPDQIREYAAFIGASLPAKTSTHCTHLKDSGYIALQESGMKAILDVAPVGPDYQPGHAHADTLSFEMSLFGQRFLVNSGTSRYGEDEERHRQRSTAAHNTVVVNGENSSEVWAGFRVARRAYPKGLAITEEPESITVSCSHTGYRRLGGKPEHHRQWVFSSGKLVVEDRVSGRPTSVEARYHFHPEVAVTQTGPDNLVATLPGGGKITLSISGHTKASLEHSTWHPEFGVTVPNLCLSIQCKQAVTTTFTW